MKISTLFITLAFLLFGCNAFAKSTNKIDSVEFGGRKYPVPLGCQTSGNMIKCDQNIISWFYEPIEDMPRHRKELLEQLIEPKTIKILLLSSEAKGYVTKIETWTALNIITELNGKCILMNLFLDHPINSTSDLPEFARQFILIKK